MSFIVGVLTVFLILNCLMLILLVLVQLPKKDAGAGLAFGSGAADALFGAGSGNALTKITKYGTIVFLVLAVILGALQDSIHSTGNASDFTKSVAAQQAQGGSPMPSQPAPAPAASAAPAKAGTNVLSTMPMLAPNAVASTNSAK